MADFLCVYQSFSKNICFVEYVHIWNCSDLTAVQLKVISFSCLLLNTFQF